ncbi:hypothetical protein AB0E69_04240 [Kribbella sp. NPDC026611]|uniref:hypothetical protein n=1 Tax=Kribbella sp. NPDC026611 TaxID=3154911 RepID=UPI00340B88EC
MVERERAGSLPLTTVTGELVAQEPEQPFRSIGPFERMIAEYEARDAVGLAAFGGFSSVAVPPPAQAPEPPPGRPVVPTQRHTLAESRRHGLRAASFAQPALAESPDTPVTSTPDAPAPDDDPPANVADEGPSPPDAGTAASPGSPREGRRDDGTPDETLPDDALEGGWVGAVPDDPLEGGGAAAVPDDAAEVGLADAAIANPRLGQVAPASAAGGAGPAARAREPMEDPAAGPVSEWGAQTGGAIGWSAFGEVALGGVPSGDVLDGARPGSGAGEVVPVVRSPRSTRLAVPGLMARTVRGASGAAPGAIGIAGSAVGGLSAGGAASWLEGLVHRPEMRGAEPWPARPDVGATGWTSAGEVGWTSASEVRGTGMGEVGGTGLGGAGVIGLGGAGGGNGWLDGGDGDLAWDVGGMDRGLDGEVAAGSLDETGAAAYLEVRRLGVVVRELGERVAAIGRARDAAWDAEDADEPAAGGRFGVDEWLGWLEDSGVVARLVEWVYPGVRRRLRGELLVDRERRGVLADLR